MIKHEDLYLNLFGKSDYKKAMEASRWKDLKKSAPQEKVDVYARFRSNYC